MLKVGDTIFQFDENHRVYERDGGGRAVGAPIYSKYFVPYVIQGETPQSWLSGPNGLTKVNKKTMRSAGKTGFGGHQWFTESAMTDQIWSAHHRRKIIDQVEKADVETIRKVANLVGYTG